VLLIFDGGKSTKPTAAPHLPKLVIELHLRVEFKLLNKFLNMFMKLLGQAMKMKFTGV
jgi:hypothetical protein